MATTYTTADTAALAAHLAAIKARTEAWVAESPTTRWACYPVQEVEFWHEQGIFTVEQYELDSLRGEFWDTYKSVHGIKPRWMNVNAMTREELEAELASLDAYVARLREQEREEAAREEARKRIAVREANARALAKRTQARKVARDFTLGAAFAQAGL